MNIINENANVHIEADTYGIFTNISLSNANRYEQNVFNDAITQLLSPINNPRYVILKTNVFGKPIFNWSFACPDVFGQNDQRVQIFKKHLIKSLINVKLIYIRSDIGRKILIKCRKYSYITYNNSFITKRQRLTKWQ